LDIAQKPTAYSPDTDYLGEKMTTTDHWADDCLDRKQEARDVIAFLQSMHGQGYSDGDHLQGKKHFTLNITAEWGAGKTFFLRRLEQELKKIGHPVIYFDAWKNDLSTDPIGAFIAQVTKGLLDQLPQSKHKTSFKKAAGNIFKAVAKTGASTLTKKFLGLALDELQEEFDGAINGIEPDKIGEKASEYITKLIDEHAKQPAAIDAFKGSIKAISADIYKDPNRKMPIYIIIDELDRCRPTYAVQLLESVKHIFETDGIYIIFGTNKKELVYTIKKVYGQEFDATGYLRRFFDMEFRLDPSETKALGEKLFKLDDQQIKKTIIFASAEHFGPVSPRPYEEMFDNMMIALGISLREQERIFYILANALRISADNASKYHFYPLLIMSVSIVCFEDSFQIAKNRLLKSNLDQLGEFVQNSGSRHDRRTEHNITNNNSLEHINDIYQQLIQVANPASEPAKFPRTSGSFLKQCEGKKVDLRDHINLIINASKFTKS
jgi:hypothetical protein